MRERREREREREREGESCVQTYIDLFTCSISITSFPKLVAKHHTVNAAMDIQTMCIVSHVLYILIWEAEV